MSDDKNLKGGQDRNRVAGDEQYEVNYIANELNVSADKVKEAIQAVGNDRAKITEYLKGH